MYIVQLFVLFKAFINNIFILYLCLMSNRPSPSAVSLAQLILAKYYEKEKIGISLVHSHHNMMYVGYHLSEVETEFAFKISWSVIW